jgi:hypothetical protein
VYRLEASLKTDRIAVPIPPNVGLAVYFWLRLGYHPLLAADQDEFMLTEGGMWMVRTGKPGQRP